MISYDCEPVSKLSYYFMTEERALQILMESKGNFIKVINICFIFYFLILLHIIIP